MERILVNSVRAEIRMQSISWLTWAEDVSRSLLKFFIALRMNTNDYEITMSADFEAARSL